MAGASNIKWCEPCSRDGENQTADSWCSDCIEPLCAECAKFHRKGKITSNHKTIPILEAEKLGSSILDISKSCQIHDDQTLSFFCMQHDQICCAFCLRESHNACKDVKSIEQASKGVKIGTAINDLQRRISEFSLMIGKILDVYKNNLSSISDQKAEYKVKIRNFRKDLNTYLDAQEQEIDTKVDACEKECKEEIEKHIKNLTARKNKSESRQTAIDTLREHASEIRIFAAVKTIDILQFKEEVLLSKFREGLVAYGLTLPTFDFLDKIKPILASLSDINIEKIQTTVKHSLKPQQVHAYKVQRGKIQLLYKCNSSKLEMEGLAKACFTTDDRMVFTGCPCRVYDINRLSIHKILVRFISKDIACDSKNNTCISFPGIGVYSIDINNLKQGHRINKIKDVSSNYECVKLHNDLIYVTIKDDIVLFNEGGSVVKTLQCKVKPTFMCVEKCGGIYISDTKSIIHMTETGSHNSIPFIMGIDEVITGLDVYEQGQLYACICNKTEGSIVRINVTTSYREPVLENIVTPRDIAFHPTKNMFLVITDKGKECTVYQVRN